MRTSLMSLLLLALMPGPLLAQGDQESSQRAPMLRERIERRFAEQVKTELGLSDAQAARLKTVATERGGERRTMRRRERELRAALDAQIADSTKAHPDSVARMTTELLDLRVRYAESWRAEMAELTFLTPVQRARLMVLRERLLQRIHEMKGKKGMVHGGHGH